MIWPDLLIRLFDQIFLANLINCCATPITISFEWMVSNCSCLCMMPNALDLWYSCNCAFVWLVGPFYAWSFTGQQMSSMSAQWEKIGLCTCPDAHPIKTTFQIYWPFIYNQSLRRLMNWSEAAQFLHNFRHFSTILDISG